MATISESKMKTLLLRVAAMKRLHDRYGVQTYSPNLVIGRRPTISTDDLALTVPHFGLPAQDLMPRRYNGDSGTSRSQPLIRAISRAVSIGIHSDFLWMPGISQFDLSHWLDVFGGSQDEVSTWYRFGFTPERALLWRRGVGLTTPYLPFLHELDDISPVAYVAASAHHFGNDRMSRDELAAGERTYQTLIGMEPALPPHELAVEVASWIDWSPEAIVRLRSAGIPVEFADQLYAVGAESSEVVLSSYQKGYPLEWSVALHRARRAAKEAVS